MKITVRPYMRRDGETMVYLNNDRGVSLGISRDKGYQSSKATPGQQKLWSAFCQMIRTATPIATGANIALHNQWKFTMFNDISFAMTDDATIGGVSVGQDGLCVVFNGDIYSPHGTIED